MSERNITRMVELLRGSSGGVSGLQVGLIAKTGPLIIKTGDVEIQKNIHVNPQVQPTLAVGDTVVIFRSDDSFYILTKAVKVS